MASATHAEQSDHRSQFDSLLPATQVDRRGFIVTALGAGFALAVQPAAAQSPIKTSAEGLTAGEVKVPVKDGEMVAYRAMPAGKTGAPVVLVVSEIFGVHEYIADVCRRLAKEGYLAAAGKQVRMHQRLGAGGIALADGGEDVAVFLQRLLQPPVQPQRVAAGEFQHLAQVVDDLLQPAVAGEFLQAWWKAWLTSKKPLMSPFAAWRSSFSCSASRRFRSAGLAFCVASKAQRPRAGPSAGRCRRGRVRPVR
jgi:hypothetical protein